MQRYIYTLKTCRRTGRALGKSFTTELTELFCTCDYKPTIFTLQFSLVDN